MNNQNHFSEESNTQPSFSHSGPALETVKLIQKQMQAFPIGQTVRFYDRRFIIEAEVYENKILNQLSVVDKQGFMHIGQIDITKNYDVVTMCSTREKIKQGYIAAKSHGVVYPPAE